MSAFGKMSLMWTSVKIGDIIMSDFVIQNKVLKKYIGNKEKVVIPDGVTSIGYCAFCYCYSLASITIPGSVTIIKAWTFQDCKSLSKITIPNGVTFIEDFAFSCCKSLASITIPDSVTCIEENAFENCPNIVIKGKKESAEEKYERKRKITFEEI